MSDKAFSLPRITKEDLHAEHPTRLNQLFRLLGEQISKTQALHGPFSFGKGPVTFQGDVSLNGAITGNLLQFDSNAAAIAGGLKTGQFYRTSTNQVMIVV